MTDIGRNSLLYRMNKGLFFLLLGSVILLGGSCKEPLPRYTDPSDYFEGKLTGTFVLTNNINQINFHLVITNKFDETFSSRALMEGTIEIISVKNPDYRKTFFLNSSNLYRARNYNPNSRILTIDPADSIDFVASWNFIDDKNRDVRDNLFIYVPDPTCRTFRRIAYQEFFTVKATMKLYERADQIAPKQLMYSLCHVNTWVNTKTCPPVDEQYACRLIQ